VKSSIFIIFELALEYGKPSFVPIQSFLFDNLRLSHLPSSSSPQIAGSTYGHSQHLLVFLVTKSCVFSIMHFLCPSAHSLLTQSHFVTQPPLSYSFWPWCIKYEWLWFWISFFITIW